LNTEPQFEIHVCAGVGAYRSFAKTHVRLTDVVVELGAAEGHTTERLAKRAARVIAVEKSACNVKRAKERCAGLSNIEWVCADAFDAREVLAHTTSADAVFVDIGGSTWPGLALHLSASYRFLFRPRVMVIRNVELNDFVAGVGTCEPGARKGLWRDPHKEVGRPRPGDADAGALRGPKREGVAPQEDAS